MTYAAVVFIFPSNTGLSIGERLSVSNMREGRSMDNRWSINSNRYPNTSTYKEATIIDFDKTMLKNFIAFTKSGVLHSV